MKQVLLRHTSIFKKFYKNPTEITSLAYTKRIPVQEATLEDQLISVTQIENSFTVITEKPRTASSLYFSAFFPTGSRNEHDKTRGVMQSIKNNYFGIAEAENFSKFQLLGSRLRMEYTYDYCVYDGFCLPQDLNDFLFTFNNTLIDKRSGKNWVIEKRHKEFWLGHQEKSINSANQELLLKNLFEGKLALGLYGDPNIVPTDEIINDFVKENFCENPGVLYISGVEHHEEMIEFLQPFLQNFKKTEKTKEKSKFCEKEVWELCANNFTFFNLSFESLPFTNQDFKYLELIKFLYQVKGYSPGQNSNLIKSLNASNYSFEDTAAFTLTAIISSAHLDNVTQLIAQDVKALLKTTKVDFEKAKHYYLIDVLRSYQDLTSRAENYMKEFYYFQKISSVDEMVNDIESLDHERFLKIVNELIRGKLNLTVLSSVQKQKITLNSLKSLIY